MVGTMMMMMMITVNAAQAADLAGLVIQCATKHAITKRVALIWGIAMMMMVAKLWTTAAVIPKLLRKVYQGHVSLTHTGARWNQTQESCK
jgi:hypothetical protein